MKCNLNYCFSFEFTGFYFLFSSSTGAVSARNIMLLKKKQARCQGVVCAMKVSDFKFHLKMKCSFWRVLFKVIFKLLTAWAVGVNCVNWFKQLIFDAVALLNKESSIYFYFYISCGSQLCTPVNAVLGFRVCFVFNRTHQMIYWCVPIMDN